MDAELDAAIESLGGWKNPIVRMVTAAAGLQWFIGAIAILLPVFAHDVVPRQGATAATEFGLDKPETLYLHDLVQTLFWIGYLFGTLSFGHLANTRGRKAAFRWSGYLGVLFLAVSAFAPNYGSYCCCRILVGFAFGGNGISAFVISSEWMSSSAGRAFIGTLGLNVFFIFGELMNVVMASLPIWGGGMAWWRGLTLMTAGLGALLAIPALHFGAVESPRWLLSRDQAAAADELIVLAAAAVKQSPPPPLTSREAPGEAGRGGAKGGGEGEGEEQAADWGQIMREPKSRNLVLAMGLLWFSVSFSYYGLNQSAAALVPAGFNVYLVSGGMALVELPANVVAFYGAEIAGRVMTCSATAVLGAVCCIGASFGNNAFTAVVSLVGKLGVTATFSAMYVLAGESFPTAIRSSGMAVSSSCARVGSMVSPVFGFSVPPSASLVTWGFCLATCATTTKLFIPETSAKSRQALARSRSQGTISINWGDAALPGSSGPSVPTTTSVLTDSDGRPLQQQPHSRTPSEATAVFTPLHDHQSLEMTSSKPATESLVGAMESRSGSDDGDLARSSDDS